MRTRTITLRRPKPAPYVPAPGSRYEDYEGIALPEMKRRVMERGIATREEIEVALFGQKPRVKWARLCGALQLNALGNQYRGRCCLFADPTIPRRPEDN